MWACESSSDYLFPCRLSVYISIIIPAFLKFSNLPYSLHQWKWMSSTKIKILKNDTFHYFVKTWYLKASEKSLQCVRIIQKQGIKSICIHLALKDCWNKSTYSKLIVQTAFSFQNARVTLACHCVPIPKKHLITVLPNI